jgi:hypothetical protein
MNKILYHTITFKVPKEQVYINKKGALHIAPTLTKTHRVSKRLGLPSIIFKSDEHILHPIIENKGTLNTEKNKINFHTISIKVPVDQVYKSPKTQRLLIAPTLTKINNLTSRQKKLSLILENDAHVLHPEITNDGTVEIYTKGTLKKPTIKPETKPKPKPKLIPQLIPEPEPIILPVPPKEITNEQLITAENKIENEIKKLLSIGKKHDAVFYNSEDIVFASAYIFLLMKYKRKCAIITNDIRALMINTNEHSDLTKKFYKNAETLSNDLLDCINRGDELIGIPLSIMFGRSRKTGHANMLIYRPLSKTIERFEPHGRETLSNQNEVNDKINEILIKMFEVKMKPYLKQYTPVYISPNLSCPVKKGFQSLESDFDSTPLMKKIEGDGFCSMWALFILELCFLNPTKSTNEILDIAYNYTKNQFPRYYKYIIRGYVLQTEKLLNDYLKKIDETDSFEFSNFKKFSDSKNKMENHLLHLLVSWDSKNSNIPKLKREQQLRNVLEKETIESINKMMLKLYGQKFSEKFTHKSIINYILHYLRTESKLNFTINSILHYYKNIDNKTQKSAGIKLCPKTGKCKIKTTCGGVRI